jgi:hypothetical protein
MSCSSVFAAVLALVRATAHVPPLRIVGLQLSGPNVDADQCLRVFRQLAWDPSWAALLAEMLEAARAALSMLRYPPSNRDDATVGELIDYY